MLIDQVTYDDDNPWPEEADGGGPTLELINPNFDNSLPESWSSSSELYGTPGAKNSVYQGLTTENILPVPIAYMLHQNYPNPFNPRTVIQYEIPIRGRVAITIFDILGREVVKLVDAVHGPGYKAVTWYGKNKSGLPVVAGLYFYQLQTPTYIHTKKMVLVR